MRTRVHPINEERSSSERILSILEISRRTSPAISALSYVSFSRRDPVGYPPISPSPLWVANSCFRAHQNRSIPAREAQIRNSGKHFPLMRRKIGHFAIVKLAPISRCGRRSFKHYQMWSPTFSVSYGPQNAMLHIGTQARGSKPKSPVRIFELADRKCGLE